jgi:hypothetical protein
LGKGGIRFLAMLGACWKRELMHNKIRVTPNQSLQNIAFIVALLYTISLDHNKKLSDNIAYTIVDRMQTQLARRHADSTIFD